MGMGWGWGKFYGDGVGMGLIFFTVSFSTPLLVFYFCFLQFIVMMWPIFTFGFYAMPHNPYVSLPLVAVVLLLLL